MNPFSPGARVVAYFRDSGGDRQELSVSQQETAVRNWCDVHGLILIRIFKDEARRGSSTVGRDGFQDMMHHFRSPDCQEAGLIIWNYQRFARDVDDAQFFRADLRRRGYILHSLNDDIPDGPAGRFFEAAIDWKNEQFLEDLSRDVKRGLNDLVSKYGAVPGIPPRGFKREPVDLGTRRDKSTHIVHRWVPDPELLPQIRTAFRMKAAGRSLKEINDETHLYKGLNAYSTFFSNKLYIGILEYGDQVIENYCEPIIDQTTWKEVQVILKQHAGNRNLSGNSPNHPRRRNSPFLLSGILFCARCGYQMSGLNRGNHQSYRCSRSKRHRDCDAKPIPKHFLEQTILEQLTGFVLTAETMQEREKIVQKNKGERLEQLQMDRSGQNKALGIVRRKIRNITNAIAESGHSRSLLQSLAELEADEAMTLSKIAKIDEAIAQPNLVMTDADIETAARYLTGELLKSEPTHVQTILRGITNRIDVERDGKIVRGRIIYYHPPGADPKAKAPREKSEPLDRGTVGAPIQRHTFSLEFSVSLTRKRP